MSEDKNIIILRHFETFEDSHKNEKIYYSKSLKKSLKFINYIENYVNSKKKINKIKFFTSKHERTIITSLIISNGLKSNIITNGTKNIEIFDPVISDLLDRDPRKEKYNKVCEKIKNKINDELCGDTLYIFISHSSLIYNLFECFCNLYSNNYDKKIKQNYIHTYSLSLINKTKKTLKCEFNINMR